MYKQWAAFKLNASIYRYHIAAGAAAYFVIPQLQTHFNESNTLAEIKAERQRLAEKGIVATHRY